LPRVAIAQVAVTNSTIRLVQLDSWVYVTIHPEIQLDQSYGRVGVGTPALLKQIYLIFVPVLWILLHV